MAIRPPVIAIVGRPNVGKSTLFNRISKKETAVVDDRPGVTRDRNYCIVEHYEFPFLLVDTGGISNETINDMDEMVKEQALIAVDQADIIIATFDASFGVHPDDELIVSLLRSRDVPVVYIGNKCDGDEHASKAAEFYALGLDDIQDLSALHGRGVKRTVAHVLEKLPNYEKYVSSARDRQAVEEAARVIALKAVEDDLNEEKINREPISRMPLEIDLDAENENSKVEIVEEQEEIVVNFSPVFSSETEGRSNINYLRENKLKSISKAVLYSTNAEVNEQGEDSQDATDELDPISIEIPELETISLALVGRPNVGKSTLLNRLVGEERAITSSMAGTTRDSLDVVLKRENQEFLLVDTAGLRKKARSKDAVERFSEIRSTKAISRSQVAVLLIDALVGPTEQDSKIAGLAHEQGKGVVIVVNKWDAYEKDHQSVKEFELAVRDEMKFCRYAPILFISALTGRRCNQVFEVAAEVARSRAMRIPTANLNKVLNRAIIRKPPALYRGRSVKLYYAAQVDIEPPKFALFFNFPRGVHFSYMRYLSNMIRDEFIFKGCDLKLIARKKS